MNLPLLTLRIAHEHDVVAARQRARQLALLLSFDNQNQVRIATAVSEIARNAYQYAGGGDVQFSLDEQASPQVFRIRVSDKGKGVANLDEILDQRYKSSTGMGLGIAGARRLMDEFDVQTGEGAGTTIQLGKAFSKQQDRFTTAHLGELSMRLAAQSAPDPYTELQQQNGELLRTLGELRNREAELKLLYTELQDSNRGLLALYSELDERASSLQRSNQVRSRFFSHMSHEFRTPLNSILGLSRLLYEEADGPLTAEQRVQVGYIRKGADELLEMVGDLLDAAKFEAGKLEVRRSNVNVAQLFATLRGMLRPLQINSAVQLVIEEPPAGCNLYTDELKVGQILRNLISNALKFTEKGYVRVSAAKLPDGGMVITVADTGFGVPAEHHTRIFEEFAQVDNPAQKRVRGTGLGLPLSKKLAELLGGKIELESEVGVGSIFSLHLPFVAPPKEEEREQLDAGTEVDSVLVIDDDETARYLVRRLFRDSRFQVVEAADGVEGLDKAQRHQPKLILLDLNMPGKSGEETLAALKDEATTRAIPVVIRTSRFLSSTERKSLEKNTLFIWNKSASADAAMAEIARVLQEPKLVIYKDFGNEAVESNRR